MIALLLVLAAPLPFARPPAPPGPTPAVYDAVWSATEYEMRFYPGGRYECCQAGKAAPAWVGVWRQEGLTLHVKEKAAGEAGDHYPCRWSVGPEGGTIGTTPAHIELWPR